MKLPNDEILHYRSDDGVTVIVERTELVRCKDCKYWHPHTQCGFDYDNDEYHDYCELLIPDDDYYAEPVNAEHYCSKGERKRKDGTK